MNPIRTRLCLVPIALVVVMGSGATGLRSHDAALPFSCEVFTASTSAADLAARFGAANVRTAMVPWGGAEGEFTEGTVLFDGTGAKLRVHWRETSNKRAPDWVSVRGTQSSWRSPSGITLGTALRSVERLNGRPFRLLGFGSDGSGTVMHWSGGRLEAENTADCRVRLRFGLDWEGAGGKASGLVNQVIGERSFSSGHPAMQELNPTVGEMFLQYGR